MLDSKVAMICKNVGAVTTIPPPPPNVMVPLPSGQQVKGSEFPYTVHTVLLEKDGGFCKTVPDVLLQATSASVIFAVFLLAMASTYAFVRLKNASAPIHDIHVRASFLVASFLFIIGTVALFMGVAGDVKLTLGPFELSSAIPAMALYLFGWLVWRGAARKMVNA